MKKKIAAESLFIANTPKPQNPLSFKSGRVQYVKDYMKRNVPVVQLSL